MPHTMTVGEVEIISLLDSSFDAPCAGLFPKVPAEAWAGHEEHVTDGKLAVSISSFVVRAGGKTIIVDTGLGKKDRGFFGNGRIMESLAELGVQPNDVDIVLATHIHIDHVGGHTIAAGDGYVPAFPKARYVFTRAEWDYWTAPDVANAPGNPYVVDSVLPLQGAANVELVDGEHRVSDEIALIPTPGHTPAHTSFLISSGGEAAVIVGDVAHSPVQVTETSWHDAFDLDPENAAVSRERIFDRIEKDGLRVAAGHFPHPGFGRVVRVENKRFWRGLA
jgi:glyoxylase-like metal-dependent hydrolase (beta-lactamase superfamily II)